MVERKNRYKLTEVNGTDFKIKESQEGTTLSAVGRRLAARDDVTSVTVDYDGVISAHFRNDENWHTEDVVPDGFRIVGVHLFESDGANAYIDIERDD